MKLAAAVLVLLSPLAVVAAEPEPAAAPPRWSVGAGVGEIFFGSDVGLFSPTQGIPFVRASLERRVGEASWLVLGVAGFYTTIDADPPGPAGIISVAETDMTEWSGRVEAGLRREVTGPRAPFAVSGFLLASAGGLSRERRYLSGIPAAEVEEDADAFIAGLAAGAAVDRELTRGLSVRISSPLVTTTWSWSEIRPRGQPSRDAKTFAASLTLAPMLELRLAF